MDKTYLSNEQFKAVTERISQDLRYCFGKPGRFSNSLKRLDEHFQGDHLLFCNGIMDLMNATDELGYTPRDEYGREVSAETDSCIIKTDEHGIPDSIRYQCTDIRCNIVLDGEVFFSKEQKSDYISLCAKSFKELPDSIIDDPNVLPREIAKFKNDAEKCFGEKMQSLCQNKDMTWFKMQGQTLLISYNDAEKLKKDPNKIGDFVKRIENRLKDALKNGVVSPDKVQSIKNIRVAHDLEGETWPDKGFERRINRELSGMKKNIKKSFKKPKPDIDMER